MHGYHGICHWRAVARMAVDRRSTYFPFVLVSFSRCAYVLTLCLGRWIIFLNMSFLLLFCDFRDAIPPILRFNALPVSHDHP